MNLVFCIICGKICIIANIRRSMQTYLLSMLSSLLFFIGLTGLLFKPLKLKYQLLLGGLLFVFAHFAASLLGNYVALLYILCAAVVILLNGRPYLMNIIFSLYGYLLLVLVCYLYTIPLSLLGLSVEEIDAFYPVPFLLFEIITVSFVIFLLRKFLFRSKNLTQLEYPGNLQRSFLIQVMLGTAAILVNIVYGEIAGYPFEVQAISGIFISLYVLSAIALFYASFKLLRKNYELTLKQRDEKALNDYLMRMEGFYDEICSFRHDYINIIASLRCYIDDLDEEDARNRENVIALKKYYRDIAGTSARQLHNDDFTLARLKNMKVPEIKSVLYNKLLLALNKKIHAVLELKEPVTEINMDTVQLARIIGILLDNAIEAAIETEAAVLKAAIINTDEAIIFMVENSTLPITIPVSRLSERGVTTKGGHDGLGLYNVMQITDQLPDVFFKITYEELFCQTLEVKKGG